MMSSLALADVLNGAGFFSAGIYRTYLILRQVPVHLQRHNNNAPGRRHPGQNAVAVHDDYS